MMPLPHAQIRGLRYDSIEMERLFVLNTMCSGNGNEEVECHSHCGAPNLLLPRLLVMEAQLSSSKQLRRATTRSITPITPPTTAAMLLPLRPTAATAAILVPSISRS